MVVVCGVVVKSQLKYRNMLPKVASDNGAFEAELLQDAVKSQNAKLDGDYLIFKKEFEPNTCLSQG